MQARHASRLWVALVLTLFSVHVYLSVTAVSRSALVASTARVRNGDGGQGRGGSTAGGGEVAEGRSGPEITCEHCDRWGMSKREWVHLCENKGTIAHPPRTESARSSSAHEEQAVREWCRRASEGVGGGGNGLRVYRDPSVNFRVMDALMGQARRFFAEAVRRHKLGVLMLWYGKSAGIEMQMVAFLHRLLLYYPRCPVEIAVDEQEALGRKREQLGLFGLSVPNIRLFAIDARNVSLGLGGSERTKNRLKPLALLKCSFDAPLLVDPDVHPCPLCLGVLGLQLLHNTAPLYANRHGGFFMTGENASLPLLGELPPKQQALFEEVQEVNTGVMCVNKRALPQLLPSWIEQYEVWDRLAKKYPEQVVQWVCDGGPFRLALYHSGGAKLPMGLSHGTHHVTVQPLLTASMEAFMAGERDEVVLQRAREERELELLRGGADGEGWSGAAVKKKKSSHLVLIQKQLFAGPDGAARSVGSDTALCHARRALMLHGPPYKYGSPRHGGADHISELNNIAEWMKANT